MGLKGSKTEDNLKAAFAGESQANRRYLYFAQKADIEGHNDVAAVFRSTAEGETGHAHGHLEYLEETGDPATGLPIGGTADNLAQKELTGVYAGEIDHVKSVTNDIVVREKAATGETMGEKIDDVSITTQVKFALLGHKSTSALKTKVTTMDGTITITGEAASDAEKSLVTKLASDVRGVKSVDNQMTVKG